MVKSNPNPIETMLRLVSCAQLSRGADGRPFARVPVEDRFEFYELKLGGVPQLARGCLP